MKKQTIYKPRGLIEGARIHQEPGTTWVAIPDNYAGREIIVDYCGAKMLIKDWKGEAVAFKRFRDKFWTADSTRRQYYTLGYFKFVPDVKVKVKMNDWPKPPQDPIKPPQEPWPRLQRRRKT